MSVLMISVSMRLPFSSTKKARSPSPSKIIPKSAFSSKTARESSRVAEVLSGFGPCAGNLPSGLALIILYSNPFIFGNSFSSTKPAVPLEQSNTTLISCLTSAKSEKKPEYMSIGLSFDDFAVRGGKLTIFKPLYSGGLCEAVTINPRSAPIRRDRESGGGGKGGGV